MKTPIQNAEDILLDFLGSRKVVYEKGEDYLIVYPTDNKGQRVSTFTDFDLATHFQLSAFNTVHKFDVRCDADLTGVYLLIRVDPYKARTT